MSDPPAGMDLRGAGRPEESSDQEPVSAAPSLTSAGPPIEILVAARPEDASRERCTGCAEARETERPHQGVHFRRQNRLVGIAAHPIVHVMYEVHSPDAMVVGDVRSKVAADDKERCPQ